MQTHGDDGQLLTQSDEILESDTDNHMTRNIGWSYYPSGEVDVITIELLHDGVVVSKLQIKHYLNGDQPALAVLQ